MLRASGNLLHNTVRDSLMHTRSINIFQFYLPFSARYLRTRPKPLIRHSLISNTEAVKSNPHSDGQIDIKVNNRSASASSLNETVSVKPNSTKPQNLQREQKASEKPKEKEINSKFNQASIKYNHTSGTKANESDRPPKFSQSIQHPQTRPLNSTIPDKSNKTAYNKNPGKYSKDHLVPLDRVGDSSEKVLSPVESQPGLAQKPLSNNKKFKSIPIDPTILHSLDLMRLGFMSTKKERMQYSKKLTSLESGPLFRKEQHQKNEIPPLFRKIGTKLNIISKVADLPALQFDNNPPEVAILGRSNVGKSSLLNRILGYNDSYVQKSSVSDKPGETRDLKFYGVRTKKIPIPGQTTVSMKKPWSLIITDMPGYGFAFLNENDKQRCFDLTRDYLLTRGKNLKRVLLLIDARHGFKIGDKEYFQQLLSSSNEIGENASKNSSLVSKVSWKLQIVLTKCDLLERTDIARRISEIEAEMQEMLKGVPGNMLKIIPLSSLENKGVVNLQKELAALVPKAPDDAPIEDKHDANIFYDKPGAKKNDSLNNVNTTETKQVPNTDRIRKQRPNFQNPRERFTDNDEESGNRSKRIKPMRNYSPLGNAKEKGKAPIKKQGFGRVKRTKVMNRNFIRNPR